MAKIIIVSDEVVTIGMEQNKIKEVRLTDCEFKPEVGMEVDVFESDTKVLVVQATVRKDEVPPPAIPGGIVVNVTNASNNAGHPMMMGPVPSNVVSKWTYIILALLLGGGGGHKFYAGKIVQGLLYLCFFWTFIPAILAVFDIIVALTKTPDGNGRIVV